MFVTLPVKSKNVVLKKIIFNKEGQPNAVVRTHQIQFAILTVDVWIIYKRIVAFSKILAFELRFFRMSVIKVNI